MRNALLFVLTFVGATLCMGAEVYPSKPVRVVAAFDAGSSDDFVGRVISTQLSTQLGKSFVVENRTGASGVIGFGAIASAPPDGYTLGIIDSAFAILPSTKKSLPFDAVKDFTQITQILRFPVVLIVRPSLNVNTIKEFVALAQANPGKFNYGSGGTGTATNVWAELFKVAVKIDITHVPYKGGGDVVNAMLSNQIEMFMTSLPGALPPVKAGRLRALAVTTDGKRSPALPDVPSMSEAGVPGVTIYSWFGLGGPAGMPADIASKLHSEVLKALAVPAVKEQFAKLDADLMGSSPEEFSAYVRDEVRRWGGVVKSAGIVPE